MPRKIELLAPAKNLECGIAAIQHGADAVYIGAPSFSARAAAGNTIEDIKALADYAHIFDVKIYVALNTILTDEELPLAEKLIWQLYSAHADAIIIQDMGITMLNLPPIPLHASTQMDNRSVEKAAFLEQAGFNQIVLARELTLDEISEIRKHVFTPLEVFVHGALCVCYSGQCYLSEALSNRSANKGSCAQYCRLPYTLLDSEGEEVVSEKHLLSMKDLNLSDNLEELLDAGVSSLKIEGRLKNLDYVKNVVAYYRLKLDDILNKRTEYIRASSGEVQINFEPNPEKSFNRGFTKYFLNNRPQDIWSVNSPKSIGEYIGKVQNNDYKCIEIDTFTTLNNGDGLCFFNKEGILQGIRVNRAEQNRVFTFEDIEIAKGTEIYRNFDQSFNNLLSKETATRKIRIQLSLTELFWGFSLTIKDENDNRLTQNFEYKKEKAKSSQTQNIIRNLSKTGDTIFVVENVEIKLQDDWFIPSSLLVTWRRDSLDRFEQIRKTTRKIDVKFWNKNQQAFPITNITYLGNVMNSKSVLFYSNHGAKVSQMAFEKEALKDVPLMFTRHCIKDSLDYCPKQKKNHPFKEPFYLKYKNVNLRLEFDCKNCEMKVYQK